MLTLRPHLPPLQGWGKHGTLAGFVFRGSGSQRPVFRILPAEDGAQSHPSPAHWCGGPGVLIPWLPVVKDRKISEDFLSDLRIFCPDFLSVYRALTRSERGG